MEAPALDLFSGQKTSQLTEEEVKGLLQTKQNFLQGKTTARPWKELRAELKARYPIRQRKQ